MNNESNELCRRIALGETQPGDKDAFANLCADMLRGAMEQVIQSTLDDAKSSESGFGDGLPVVVGISIWQHGFVNKSTAIGNTTFVLSSEDLYENATPAMQDLIAALKAITQDAQNSVLADKAMQDKLQAMIAKLAKPREQLSDDFEERITSRH